MEAIRKITSFVFDTASGVKKITIPLRNALTFSAADERISYKKELCVAIEKTGVSLAYGTRFLSSLSVKGMRHYHYSSAEHAYPQPKEAASSVVLAISEFGAVGAGIILSIPKSWAIVRIVEFPVTVKENISDVVTYELDRLFPFSPEEAFYDFIITGETPDNITLAIAASKADLIKSYCAALADERLSVDRVTLNLTSIGSLCRSLHKNRDALFIETDSDEYEGALFLDSSLAGVVSGRFSADDDASRADIISAEMRPLIDTAKRRDNDPRLFALLRGSPALKERLRTSLAFPVSLLDEIDTGLGLSSGQKNVLYAAAGGVMESLQPGHQKLNLLSRGLHERAKTPMGLTAVLVALLMVLWIMCELAPIRVETKRLREIEGQIKIRKSGMKDWETLKNQIDAINSEVETINGFKENRPMTLTILKELTEVLPRSAWLTRVNIGQSTVNIEGYSTSSASELLSRLEASKHLGKAEFASPTFRDVRMMADRFNIKMEIRGAKEMKVAPHKDDKK
ncbi:MAG: PilN domain-containing protein [Dissulfurispiraceae bacterium]